MVKIKAMILKANLHFHTKEDYIGVDYDLYKYIDFAKEKGFDVLAYTPHIKFLFKKEYTEYAANKGILLIPGAEIKIKKKDIVVLNCGKEIENVKSFQELVDYKNKNPHIFILAPHPFVFGLKNLRGHLLKHIDLFDAIEMSVYSNKILNFNKKAEKTAQKYGKPLIATSDTHFLPDIERGYALIEVEAPTLRPESVGGRGSDRSVGKKTIRAVFSAVKKGNFRNKMNSMNLLDMLIFYIKILLNILI